MMIDAVPRRISMMIGAISEVALPIHVAAERMMAGMHAAKMRGMKRTHMPDMTARATEMANRGMHPAAATAAAAPSMAATASMAGLNRTREPERENHQRQDGRDRNDETQHGRLLALPTPPPHDTN